MTKKDLLYMAEALGAFDITTSDSDFIRALIPPKSIKSITKTFGTYGVNAVLVVDEYDNAYVIKARNSNAMIF